MERAANKIEGLDRHKILLLQDLLHCLKQERENLINLDLDCLWEVMEEKNRLLTAIAENEAQLEKMRNEVSRNGEKPDAESLIPGSLSLKIHNLQGKIRTRVKGNVAFIQESLEFFDEIISIFTMGGRVEHSYGHLTKNQKEFSPLIYHREV
ncbi:flagellar export chaperone FlgN [Thermodesulfobacteriota bacterium]